MSDNDHTRHLEMLVQIAELLSTLDLDQVLTQIIALTTDTTGATRGSFFLLDEEGSSLQRFIAARDLPSESKAVVSRYVLERGLAGWVITNRRSALVTDTWADDRWITLEDDTEQSRVRSAICVPFFVNDSLRGVMTLEHPDAGYFTPEDLRLVEAAASQAANALRNAQLFDRVQTQQQQLEGVLHSITDVLMVVDGRWRLKLFNPAALSLIGKEAGAVASRTLDEIATLTGRSLFSRLKEAIAAHDARQQSFELREEESSRDFAVNVSALDRGEGQGYVIALHDVTSLKDLNRLKTHMIQMASHDLKNPIGVLRGYLDVIREDAANGLVPDPAFLENMYKSIARMETLVNNLLDVQRAERDSPLQRDLINPHELVDAVLEDMLPSIEQRGHKLVRRIQKRMKPIKGDFLRLQEVMNNLIENAVKYTPEGGTIMLTAFTESDRFGFQVRDTGYGIPQDKHPYIFQPYFRAETEGTEHIPGTGVGLSLVKAIVEQHGGHVWFNSTEGQGSTFGFWLPLLT